LKFNEKNSQNLILSHQITIKSIFRNLALPSALINTVKRNSFVNNKLQRTYFLDIEVFNLVKTSVLLLCNQRTKHAIKSVY